jgi:hypothetical protein
MIIQLQGEESATTNVPTTGETDPIAAPSAQANQESRGHGLNHGKGSLRVPFRQRVGCLYDRAGDFVGKNQDERAWTALRPVRLTGSSKRTRAKNRR